MRLKTSFEHGLVVVSRAVESLAPLKPDLPSLPADLVDGQSLTQMANRIIDCGKPYSSIVAIYALEAYFTGRNTASDVAERLKDLEQGDDT